MKKIFIFIIFLFLPYINLKASAPALILKSEQDAYSVGKYLDILEDKTNQLTIYDVTKPEWASKFKRSKEDIVNFGFSNSTFWAKLTITNNSSH